MKHKRRVFKSGRKTFFKGRLSFSKLVGCSFDFTSLRMQLRITFCYDSIVWSFYKFAHICIASHITYERKQVFLEALFVQTNVPSLRLELQKVSSLQLLWKVCELNQIFITAEFSTTFDETKFTDSSPAPRELVFAFCSGANLFSKRTAWEKFYLKRKINNKTSENLMNCLLMDFFLSNKLRVPDRREFAELFARQPWKRNNN